MVEIAVRETLPADVPLLRDTCIAILGREVGLVAQVGSPRITGWSRASARHHPRAGIDLVGNPLLAIFRTRPPEHRA